MKEMLERIRQGQWALADIDWDAPGRERIRDEQRPALRAFMADLVWIENIGARGFAAMAKKAETHTLREIYSWFHAEEQRHANAELALMRRWGMLEGDDLPEPNVNVRLAIEWLDRHSDDMPLTILGTVIPMLEVALDGALVKFLLDEVDDPLCHRVFELINRDESRHLAVDFEVLDMLGALPFRRRLIEAAGALADPALLIGILMYVPLLNKMYDNVLAMGLAEERLSSAMRRFSVVGRRSANTRRLPSYQVIEQHVRMVTNRRHPYHRFANAMVRLTARYPRRFLRATPSWSKELTADPIAP